MGCSLRLLNSASKFLFLFFLKYGLNLGIKFHEVYSFILVWSKHLFHEFLNLFWYANIYTFIGRKINAAGKSKFFLIYLFYNLFIWFSIIWLLTVKHFIQNNTQRPHITFFWIIFLFDRVFWVYLRALLTFISLCTLFVFILFAFSMEQSENIRRHISESSYFRLSLKSIAFCLTLFIKLCENFDKSKIWNFNSVIFKKEVFRLS